jgi:hypothetical protein
LNKSDPVVCLELPFPSIQRAGIQVNAVDHMTAWYMPIWEYLTITKQPEDAKEARRIKRIVPMYTIREDNLYKCSYMRPWMRCVHDNEIPHILVEIHEGICGSHQGAKTLSKRVLRARFFSGLHYRLMQLNWCRSAHNASSIAI